VLYAPDSDKSAVLRGFAAALVERGWRVGGVVIDTLWDGNGRKVGLDLIDLGNARRRPLSRPDTVGIELENWVLDPATVAEGAAAIRRAAAAPADLVIVDKFGPLEGRGEGYAKALAAALATGVPLLVALRSEFLAPWDAFCRAAAAPPGVPVRHEMAALFRWWGPERLFEELARQVADTPTRRVMVGLNWTLVEGPDGCGLAHTPARGTGGCLALPRAGEYAGASLRALAGLILSRDPFERALGAAAINAHYNRRDLRAGDTNGLDGLAAGGGRVVIVGRFPGLERRLPGALVIEREPGPQDYPEDAAERLIPGSAAVAITASSFANGSLPRLLRLADGARTVLIGPGTPLAPALHAYGIDRLAGLVVEDADGAARAVMEGGAVKALKPYVRYATLEAV
jgi:uncharacterized protein (DUF4213/DUF364 family)/nucleoside-triphosphatase THEP1